VLTVAAAGTMVATAAGPAAAFQFGKVSVSPSKNLVNNDTVTVNISDFGNDTGPATTLYVVECTPKIVSPPNDPSHCDESDPTAEGQPPTAPEHVVKITNATNGSATAVFQVHTGANWLGKAPGDKCDAQNSCYVVVTDGQTAATTSWAGFAPVTFKDTRAVTKTKVKAPKSVKAGKTLKLKATTTGGTALSGKVTFKDGKKKIKVKEKASGVVTAKEKHVKKGKHTITATYSGDSKNQPSSGKAKVKVKK
jgi:hypothetical protein